MRESNAAIKVHTRYLTLLIGCLTMPPRRRINTKRPGASPHGFATFTRNKAGRFVFVIRNAEGPDDEPLSEPTQLVLSIFCASARQIRGGDRNHHSGAAVTMRMDFSNRNSRTGRRAHAYLRWAASVRRVAHVGDRQGTREVMSTARQQRERTVNCDDCRRDAGAVDALFSSELQRAVNVIYG
jgi:hypothetical protein